MWETDLQKLGICIRCEESLYLYDLLQNMAQEFSKLWELFTFTGWLNAKGTLYIAAGVRACLLILFYCLGDDLTGIRYIMFALSSQVTVAIYPGHLL